MASDLSVMAYLFVHLVSLISYTLFLFFVCVFFFPGHLLYYSESRYNDSICSQRYCHESEFAVVKHT